MKTQQKKIASGLTMIAALALAGQAGAATIDVNKVFDTTAVIAGNANWSGLTWDNGAPNSAGAKAGVDGTVGDRTLTMDTDVTLGQLQLFNIATTTLNGSGTITWDTGDASVAQLGRNRGPMGNYSAGRTFDVSASMALVSSLRVSNWVESRTTVFNSTTSGSGNLDLRTINSGAATGVSIGGTGANTHLGGTTISIASGLINLGINKDDAFGSGDLWFRDTTGVNSISLNTYSSTVNSIIWGDTTFNTKGDYSAVDLNTQFGTTKFSDAGGMITIIPEPSSIALLGLAGFGLFVRRKR